MVKTHTPSNATSWLYLWLLAVTSLAISAATCDTFTITDTTGSVIAKIEACDEWAIGADYSELLADLTGDRRQSAPQEWLTLDAKFGVTMITEDGKLQWSLDSDGSDQQSVGALAKRADVCMVIKACAGAVTEQAGQYTKWFAVSSRRAYELSRGLTSNSCDAIAQATSNYLAADGYRRLSQAIAGQIVNLGVGLAGGFMVARVTTVRSGNDKCNITQLEYELKAQRDRIRDFCQDLRRRNEQQLVSLKSVFTAGPASEQDPYTPKGETAMIRYYWTENNVIADSYCRINGVAL